MFDTTLPFRWDGRILEILDQTQLPEKTIFFPVDTLDTAVDAIKKLKVRGAPALGAAGALMLPALTSGFLNLSPEEFFHTLEEYSVRIGNARPTAVNLSWAVNRVIEKARQAYYSGKGTEEIFKTVQSEAEYIFMEDRELCRSIGENGLPLIKPGMSVLTHCNAGALATSGIGTATAPLYVAHSKGIPFEVYADETRPLLQGSRLTAWELDKNGIPVTVICDNMAAFLMSSGKIDLVITGADRIASNGDTANKIGTLGLAILCSHFNIPFYIAAPYSTFDPELSDGTGIPVELRDGEEITCYRDRRTAPEGINTWNPSFDITPGSLITGFISEMGIHRAPYQFARKESFRL